MLLGRDLQRVLAAGTLVVQAAESVDDASIVDSKVNGVAQLVPQRPFRALHAHLPREGRHSLQGDEAFSGIHCD